jgi:hypothetical protein
MLLRGIIQAEFISNDVRYCAWWILPEKGNSCTNGGNILVRSEYFSGISVLEKRQQKEGMKMPSG